jgi:hypothetical protein
LFESRQAIALVAVLREVNHLKLPEDVAQFPWCEVVEGQPHLAPIQWEKRAGFTRLKLRGLVL